MRGAIGEAETQERLRVMPGDQSGAMPMESRVGDMENVAAQFDIGERRAAQLRQPLHQWHRRVVRRAGKRPEAGDEDAQFVGHFTKAPHRHAREGGHPVNADGPVIPSGSSGILDRPPEPVVGRRVAPTRWRTMTVSYAFPSSPQYLRDL